MVRIKIIRFKNKITVASRKILGSACGCISTGRVEKNK